MLLFIRSGITWLRQNVDRRELACAGIALIAAYLLWREQWLRLPVQLALGAVLLVALAVLARLLVPRLLGPVFFYDLVRTSRRNRYFLLRGGYASVLLVVLLMFYTSWFSTLNYVDLAGGKTVPKDQLALLADLFFMIFAMAQMVMVLLLTPVFTGGAIAEEKEQRTLEYLLATDLSDREIILGKLASRLSSLTLLVLAGLPILSMVQFLGGVDPNLVLAGFAATLLTMVSVASLGLLNSVYCRRSRGAIFLTYLEVAFYLVASSCCVGFLSAPTPLGILTIPGTGNFVIAVIRLFEARASNTLATELWTVLRDYAIFHGLVTAFCVIAATRMLRRELRQHASGTVRIVQIETGTKGEYLVVNKPIFEPPPPYRPPLAESKPVLWKELYFESGLRLSQLALAIAQTLAGIVLYIAGAFFVTGVVFALATDHGLTIFSNIWVRAVGTPIACLMLIAVAVRAAGAVSGEREQQTLDGLLATPLDQKDIVWGKGWASIRSVSKAWWCLGTIWFLGMVTGGVCPFALPLLAAAWFVYAALVAGLGLCFSLTSRTTLRATVLTLLAIVVVGGGHWVVRMAIEPFLNPTSSFGKNLYSSNLHLYGLTPPWTLWFLAFNTGDFDYADQSVEGWERLGFALLGLVVYGLMAAFIWGWLLTRFDRVTGRIAMSTQHASASNELPTSDH